MVITTGAQHKLCGNNYSIYAARSPKGTKIYVSNNSTHNLTYTDKPKT